MDTPQRAEHKNYTSPIRQLKSTHPPPQNAYEEEFYRIKTQRLETEIQELKLDNHALKNKLLDSNTMIQMLKERILVLEQEEHVPSFVGESRRSPVKQSKYRSAGDSQRGGYTKANVEIQRLSKEVRVLKNDHEIQMSKLRDENKRLQRKLTQAENNTSRLSESVGVSKVRTKLQFDEQKGGQKLGELLKQNSKLKENYDQCLVELRDFRNKIKQHEEENSMLKKQVQQNAVLKSSQARSADSLKAVQKQLQRLEEEVAVLQQENQLLQNQVQPEEKEKDIQESNEIKKYKSKIKQLEEKLGEKNEQMEEMLMKLKPLLKKDRSSLAESRKEERGDSKRASLSMLEVFLTKYKISMF